MVEAIGSSELKGINKATEQIHSAAQFLSAFGEYLGRRCEDGSHSNMGWLTIKEKFITHPVGGKEEYVLELSPEKMEITLVDLKEKTWTSIKLKGETKDSTLEWIKTKLQKNGTDGASEYRLAFPYELPEYAHLNGEKFKHSPKKAFLAFSKLRSWGEYFINKHKVAFEFAEDSRTWPHHFDHSSYIPLKKTKSGEISKSITIGLAIHDGMIDEPYFYISAWNMSKKLDLSEMKDLSSGYWLNESFKGAVLPVNDLADDLLFEEKVDNFYNEAKAQLLKLLKYKD